MNRRNFLKNIGVLSIGISSQLSARSAFARLNGSATESSSLPNIVFILADDFGYSSLKFRTHLAGNAIFPPKINLCNCMKGENHV